MKKRINLPIDTIINDDNVAVLQKMPSHSVDLIFADPPYNLTLSKDLVRPNGQKYDGVQDDWDKYDSLQDYDQECHRWLKECLRVLKRTGSLWVIGSFQNIHRLGYILQDAGAWIINEIVWEKTNPVPNFAGSRFTNAQETLLWVVPKKHSPYCFNYKTMKQINGGRQMRSVWRFPTCIGSERLKDGNGRKIHTTQKPLELLRRIILATTHYGDLVLDPFNGTGTTTHAAKELGRHYIGIECDPAYYQASLQRMESVVERTDIDDLKFARYDQKLPRVTFQDLLAARLVQPGEAVQIRDQWFIFNDNGKITYQDQQLSPNQLCRILFGQPTNAWNVIKNRDGVTMNELRTAYWQQQTINK